jgi:hypothetical protein
LPRHALINSKASHQTSSSISVNRSIRTNRAHSPNSAAVSKKILLLILFYLEDFSFSMLSYYFLLGYGFAHCGLLFFNFVFIDLSILPGFFYFRFLRLLALNVTAPFP